jgi:hypothetical protein
MPPSWPPARATAAEKIAVQGDRQLSPTDALDEDDENDENVDNAPS